MVYAAEIAHSLSLRQAQYKPRRGTTFIFSSITARGSASAWIFYKLNTHHQNNAKDFDLLSDHSEGVLADRIPNTDSVRQLADYRLLISACLDYSLLEFPLTVRKWQKGDWFVPLGMKGRKKISDYLIDSKVPLYSKDHTFVLTTSGGNIMWLIGYRIDERFKVTGKTKKVLVVKKLS